MYIAIEGLKGTGKTTLFQQLVFALKCDGVDVETFNPTRPMPQNIWWEQVQPNYEQDAAYREALYTARAQYHAQKTDFNAPLILGDRSIVTSFITRWPQQDNNISAYIERIRKQEYILPIPDLVLYLDAPIDVIVKRLTQRERDYGLVDEQLDQLNQAKKAYEQFFKMKNEFGFNHLKYQYFDASQNQYDIFNQVYEIFKKNLANQSIFQ